MGGKIVVFSGSSVDCVVVRACWDTEQTSWSSWKRCSSSRFSWVELLSRNKCWRWSSSPTTQTTLWVFHLQYFFQGLCARHCVLKVEVDFIFFLSCICQHTVQSLHYCCCWDPVQQGADLLISALHSCSFHWSKVRANTAITIWNLFCIFKVGL